MAKNGRFSRIEKDSVLVGVTKKGKESDRFERLEFGKEEGREEKNIPDGKKYFPCPACKRNNRKGNLYCIYCGEIFPDIAENTESGLKPYEIKCPECSKVGNKNQKRCMWCGYRFVWTDEDILKEGAPVEIEVNGMKYKSTDRYLPGYIKDAMVRMKKEKLSTSDAEEILKGLQIKRFETRTPVLQSMEKNREKVSAYIILAAGGIVTFSGMIFMHLKKPSVALFFFVPGFLVIISGMAMLAMAERET